MNRCLMTSFIVATVMLTNISDAAQPSLTAKDYGWRSDYDRARADARKMNRPLMVVFRCVP